MCRATLLFCYASGNRHRLTQKHHLDTAEEGFLGISCTVHRLTLDCAGIFKDFSICHVKGNSSGCCVTTRKHSTAHLLWCSKPAGAKRVPNQMATDSRMMVLRAIPEKYSSACLARWCVSQCFSVSWITVKRYLWQLHHEVWEYPVCKEGPAASYCFAEFPMSQHAKL